MKYLASNLFTADSKITSLIRKQAVTDVYCLVWIRGWAGAEKNTIHIQQEANYFTGALKQLFKTIDLILK